ncbi:MAG: hypothetical protein LLG02_00500 [Pelosinus sp.]|nr:hypothetical protein [Pelosinus sp.]
MAGAAGINLNVSLLGRQYTTSLKNSIGNYQSGAQDGDVFANLNTQAGPAYQLELSLKNGQVDDSNPEVREMKRTGKIECQTCAQRKYQDESTDAGVSFKSPAHIAPENAASIVQSHEQEHIINAQNRSLQEDTKIVSQSVQLYSAICPECGRSYISGGQASTTTVKTKQPSQQGIGGKVDMLM